MGTLLTFFTGLGLSTAAGLNAFLPILVVGILGRAGFIQLSAPFDILSEPIVLLIVGILVLLDFVADKVPAIDSVIHTGGLIVAPIAGAVLFIAQSGAGEVDPIVAGVAGLIVAGGTHAARSALRPTVTAATAGTGNPIMSLIEDVFALILTVLAILMPVVAVILAVILFFVAFRFFRGALGIWKKDRPAT